MPLTQSNAAEGSLANVPLWRRDRTFYTAFSLAAIATVLSGFGPTYYAKAYTGAPPISTFIHLHAALFSAWMALFSIQTFLVAAKRTDIHRRLGIFGVVLALATVVAGYGTAVAGAQTGWAGPGTPRDAAQALRFLVIPLGDLVLFVGFLATALYLRRKPETHKRLMLLAMIGGILPPAFGRLPAQVGIGLVLIFLSAGPVYDGIFRGRIHRAYVWGTTLILISLPLRFVIAGTDSWRRFAEWLTH
jgi:hypothetical protein